MVTYFDGCPSCLSAEELTVCFGDLLEAPLGIPSSLIVTELCYSASMFLKNNENGSISLSHWYLQVDLYRYDRR
jgi:hypothetical protein